MRGCMKRIRWRLKAAAALEVNECTLSDRNNRAKKGRGDGGCCGGKKFQTLEKCFSILIIVIFAHVNICLEILIFLGACLKKLKTNEKIFCFLFIVKETKQEKRIPVVRCNTLDVLRGTTPR